MTNKCNAYAALSMCANENTLWRSALFTGARA